MRALVLITTLFALGACGVDQSGAQEWVQKHYPGAELDCMSVDSDGDGYVSCTVFPPKGPAVPIECARSFTLLVDGCRIARVGR